MFCLKCEHQITGVQSGTCPECGQPFDPRNLRTFARTRRDLTVVRPYRRTCREFMWMLGVCLVVLVIGLVAVLMSSTR